MKAKRAVDAVRLEQIPNIGPAIARELEAIGIYQSAQLRGKNGLTLYSKLCRVRGRRIDPCVADTFMAAVDFMDGGKPKPWWKFTSERKKLLRKG